MTTLRIKIIVVLSALLTTENSLAMERIDVDTVSQIDKELPDRYYVINKPLEMRDSVELGTGCVLCFEPGGRLVGKRMSDGQLPKLKLNELGTGVRAWDMCIFENITVTGNFTNSYIPAEWFGTEDMDDASNGCEIARCT